MVVRRQRVNKPRCKKKSNGVKSGDLGGQAIGPPLPTQHPGKFSSKNVVTSLPTLKCTDVHKNLFGVTLYTVGNINCIKLLGTKNISMYFCIPLARTPYIVLISVSIGHIDYLYCCTVHSVVYLRYIVESNPHPFYSFRGLKKSDAY